MTLESANKITNKAAEEIRKISGAANLEDTQIVLLVALVSTVDLIFSVVASTNMMTAALELSRVKAVAAAVKIAVATTKETAVSQRSKATTTRTSLESTSIKIISASPSKEREEEDTEATIATVGVHHNMAAVVTLPEVVASTLVAQDHLGARHTLLAEDQAHALAVVHHSPTSVLVVLALTSAAATTALHSVPGAECHQTTALVRRSNRLAQVSLPTPVHSAALETMAPRHSAGGDSRSC